MAKDKTPAAGMADLKAEEVAGVLTALWYTPGIDRWGTPVLVTGAPGGAKTALMKDTCRKAGLRPIPVLASLRQPQDFMGMPIPIKEPAERDRFLAAIRAQVPGARAFEKADGIVFALTDYAPPRWAVEAAAAEHAVIILDEANRTVPLVQNALLRVTLEGVVGDFELPPTVRFVAIMNPAGSAGTWDLSDALANRFGHFRWPMPTVAQWSSYMSGAQRVGKKSAQAAVNPAELEAVVEAGWSDAYAKAVGHVSGFLYAKPGLHHHQPEQDDPTCSQAWPSPRTWDMATRALASARIHGLSESTQLSVVTAFVGPGAGAEFCTWASEADLPDPRALLDGGTTWSHSPTRLDRTVAVLQSCATIIKQAAPSTERTKRAEKLWELMRPIVDTAPDVCIPAGQALAPERIATGTPAGKAVCAKLWPTLEATKGLRQ